MHPLAQRVVRRILDGGGTLPLPSAFADLQELERLAQAVSTRETTTFDLLESPVYIGPVAFYPPTLGVMVWGARVRDWFPGEPELPELAVLYALTLAESQEYRELTHPDQARRAIHRWALRHRIPVSAASEVLNLFFPPPTRSPHAVVLKALRAEHGSMAAAWPAAALQTAVGEWLEAMDETEAALQRKDLNQSVVFMVAQHFGGSLDHWIFEASFARLMAAADEVLADRERKTDEELSAKGDRLASRWSVEAQKRFNVFARALERRYLPAPAPAPASPPGKPAS